MVDSAAPVFERPEVELSFMSVSEGADSIAAALKLDEAVFDGDGITPDPDGLFYLPGHILLEQRASVVRATSMFPLALGDKSFVLQPALPAGVLDYMSEHCGVNKEKVIEVNTKTDFASYRYPDNAIAHAVLKDERLKNIVKGKTWLPFFATKAWLKAAKKVGAQTLYDGASIMVPNPAVAFNSKARVMMGAAKGQYNVSPFVIATGVKDIDRALADLKRQAESLRLDPDNIKYWIKSDRMVGGRGVFSLDLSKGNDLESIKNKLSEMIGEDYADEMPIVLDIDYGDLPCTGKRLGNFAIHAIVSDDEIHLVEALIQETGEDGSYAFSRMPLTPEEKAAAQEMMHWAYPALKALQKDGYRGNVCLDGMLYEKIGGGQVGFITEINARLGASFAAVALLQNAQKRCGLGTQACFSNAIYAFNEPINFETLRQQFDSVLFKSAIPEDKERMRRTGGIIPITLGQADNEPDKIVATKFLLVSPNTAALKNLETQAEQIACAL